MFDLLNVIAKTNSGTDHEYLNAFRLKDNRAYATNNTTTICADQLPFAEMDCLLDAPAFMKNLGASKSPKFLQEGTNFRIQDEKMNVTLTSQETSKFPDIHFEEPTGDSLDVSDKFVNSIRCLAPFVKQDDARVILYGGYAYITDRATLVRTPINLSIQEPVLLSRSAVDLLAAIKKQPVEILLDSNTMSVIFEDCWVRTSRWANVGDSSKYANFFTDFDGLDMMSFDEYEMKQFIHMCTSADKEDIISTGAEGIEWRGTKQRIHIDHPLPAKRFKPYQLLTVLKNAKLFNWDKPDMLLFADADIQGVLTTHKG